MSNLLSENFRAYSSPKFLPILPNYKKNFTINNFLFQLDIKDELKFLLKEKKKFKFNKYYKKY